MDLILGIERETHRMSREGGISGHDQPSNLVPPSFTKDFAESQLEIVTRPHSSIASLISELDGLTSRARKASLPELLWPFSMPPRLPPDSDIRIAALGKGMKGREGELYRLGLASRYGKSRQMICGLHLNVSMSGDFALQIQREYPPAAHESGGRGTDALYLRLARNLYKDLPHLVLLTGVSPLPGGLAVDATRAAVSHRNGGFGYARSEFRPYLDLSSVERYLAGVRRGLGTESERFRALGLVDRGRPVQLNARVFQTEKEFYAPIRFKRAPLGGETVLRAIENRGIEYLELRFFDVDPFFERGISEETLLLMRLFMLDDLTRASGQGTPEALARSMDEAGKAALMDPTVLEAAAQARGPQRGIEAGDVVPVLQARERLTRAGERLESLRPLARKLDRGMGDDHEAVLENAIGRISCPARLPSARLLKAYEASMKDWTAFGMEIASTDRRKANDDTREPAQAASDARVVSRMDSKGVGNELEYSRV